MAQASRWMRLDVNTIDNPPAKLEDTDECIFAREYTAGQNYSHSETNNLIYNFKKSVDRKGSNSWRYKLSAIRQFSAELQIAFRDFLKPGQYLIAAIPPSKCKSDPLYDDRVEQAITAAIQPFSDIQLVEPFELKDSRTASHSSGTLRPKIKSIIDSLNWNGIPDQPTTLILVDDVITTGRTFKACQSIVNDHSPETDVIGIFWARTIWTSTGQDSDA